MRQEFDLKFVSEIVSVSVYRNRPFLTLGTIRERTEGMLTFLDDKKYIRKLLENNNIVAVCTTKDLAELLPEHYGLVVSDNPRNEFFSLHNYLQRQTNFYWTDFANEIDSESFIHPSANIANKNVRIGKGVVIEAGVTVLERSIIGDNVIIRAGSTIGSEGFYFSRNNNQILSVAHAAGVVLSEGVEIQANCAISRGVFHDSTCLGENTKLDNLVHIAHNVKIGRRCLLAANAMIAGSVTIGDDVWIGPSSSISNELTIGDRAYITIGSVVTRDLLPGQRVSGNFAIPHDKFIQNYRKLIR